MDTRCDDEGDLELKSEMSIPSVQGKEQKSLRTVRRRDLLRREIILTLMIKVIVIFALWYAFFSDPVDETLTDSQVGNILFGTPQSKSTSPTEDDKTLQLSRSQNDSIRGEK
jgi:hypothetical protein